MSLSTLVPYFVWRRCASAATLSDSNSAGRTFQSTSMCPISIPSLWAV